MIYKISRWIALSVFTLLIIIPTAMVVLGTFKTDLEIYDSPMSLPLNWTLDNYRRLLDDGEILTNFKNSVFVTSLSVLITLVLASMVSFAIARMMNVTGKVLFVLFSLGLAIPGQVNIIPIYLLFNDLGLTNTYHGLIAVNVVATLPISVFILTSFFKEIPNEMYEVASIDGATHFKPTAIKASVRSHIDILVCYLLERFAIPSFVDYGKRQENFATCFAGLSR